MANFSKYANLSPRGWTEASRTQVIAVGQNAHIGLWGGGPAGEVLGVAVGDPTICVIHEEPPNARYIHWRHFLITALRDGETKITAKMPNGALMADMVVKVGGHAGVRLVFFPGERMTTSAVVGTIYVIGRDGSSIQAAGGPPGAPPGGLPAEGGHTAESTPPGDYVLGPRIHVTTTSWPMSVIPWGAALRINAGGEVEYQSTSGGWRLATGPDGEVTQAAMAFERRSGHVPVLADQDRAYRAAFFDPKTGGLRSATWELNDFGVWGWNLLRNGHPTPYYIHTTPDNEANPAAGLANSHGCIHLVPAERDRLMNAGVLKPGTPFEVRPYTEAGPP